MNLDLSASEHIGTFDNLPGETRIATIRTLINKSIGEALIPFWVEGSGRKSLTSKREDRNQVNTPVLRQRRDSLYEPVGSAGDGKSHILYLAVTETGDTDPIGDTSTLTGNAEVAGRLVGRSQESEDDLEHSGEEVGWHRSNWGIEIRPRQSMLPRVGKSEGGFGPRPTNEVGRCYAFGWTLRLGLEIN